MYKNGLTTILLFKQISINVINLLEIVFATRQVDVNIRMRD